MSNTMLRVTSAIVMVLLLSVVVWLGQSWLLYLSVLLGVLLVDEILINLLKLERPTVKYWIAQGDFLFFAIFFAVLDRSGHFIDFFNNAALVNNTILLIYLFYVKMDNEILLRIFRKIPYLVAIYIFLPVVSLGYIIGRPDWLKYLTVFLLINFGMDTGAWFVGKNIGRRKLWPTVSPNKTIEGLVGGVIIAGLVGSFAWFLFFGKICVSYFLIFSLLGLLSQLGDLIQSKLKRQCNIKDSSNLIPGHGGIYDRLDSLLFLAPFFVLVIKYLQ